MAENEGAALTITPLLEDTWVEVHGYETARKVGRAPMAVSGDMGELCGHCWRYCSVGADGRISPRTMSTSWSIGLVSDGKSLTTVLDFTGQVASFVARLQIGSKRLRRKSALRTIPVHPGTAPGPCAPDWLHSLSSRRR